MQAAFDAVAAPMGLNIIFLMRQRRLLSRRSGRHSPWFSGLASPGFTRLPIVSSAVPAQMEPSRRCQPAMSDGTKRPKLV